MAKLCDQTCHGEFKYHKKMCLPRNIIKSTVSTQCKRAGLVIRKIQPRDNHSSQLWYNNIKITSSQRCRQINHTTTSSPAIVASRCNMAFRYQVSPPAIVACMAFQHQVSPPAIVASRRNMAFRYQVSPPAIVACMAFQHQVSPPAIVASRYNMAFRYQVNSHTHWRTAKHSQALVNFCANLYKFIISFNELQTYTSTVLCTWHSKPVSFFSIAFLLCSYSNQHM
jgi:hypothetical protein